MEWYTIVLLISSGLFLVSSLISIFLGDVEIGVDSDLDSDNIIISFHPGRMSLGDIFSFKGLLHFTIGFSLTLFLMNGLTLLTAAIGTVVGLVFAFVLYYLYKIFFKKLQQQMKYTTDIKDMIAEVYFWNESSKMGEVFVTLEGRPVTITLKSDIDLKLVKGQKILVTGTRQCVEMVSELK